MICKNSFNTEEFNILFQKYTVNAMIKATGIFAKLKDKISGLKNKKIKTQSQEQTEKEPIKQTSKKAESNFDEVCPRVVVNEEMAIEKMQSNKVENKTKNTDTYGDGDPDGDDLDL